MAQQDKTIDIGTEAVAVETAAGFTETKETPRFEWLAATSLLLAITAWISGGYSAVTAVAISAASIIAGALALKSHRQGVRNTAITSIIAAAVLLVVICAFYVVIYVGLKSV